MAGAPFPALEAAERARRRARVVRQPVHLTALHWLRARRCGGVLFGIVAATHPRKPAVSETSFGFGSSVGSERGPRPNVALRTGAVPRLAARGDSSKFSRTDRSRAAVPIFAPSAADRCADEDAKVGEQDHGAHGEPRQNAPQRHI